MKKIFGYGLLVSGLLLGFAFVAFPTAVTQVAGLAVAQSSTKWNSVKDMAQGDTQTTGVGLSAPCLWNGTSCDRARGTIAGGQEVAIKTITGGVTPADNLANPTNALSVAGLNEIWNASSSLWNRWAGISNTGNTATTSLGAAYTTTLNTWTVTNTPAVATQATVSKASGGGSVRHVAQSITVCVAANGTAQVPILFHLRDGATGAGTILRTWAMSAPVTSSQCATQEGLNITGSAATAMTIESAAAPVAASQATVSLGGYSTP